MQVLSRNPSRGVQTRSSRRARLAAPGRGLGVALVTLACAPSSGIDPNSPEVVWGRAGIEAPVASSEPPPAIERPRAAVPAFSPEIADAARKVSEAARGQTRAWERLAYMVDSNGPRLSGSRALEQSIDWAIETMKADGLANVRREEVMVPHWVRGRESARVISPRVRELPMLGLGGSVGTRGKLRADTAVVASLEEIPENAARLKGKIVVINLPMPDFDHVQKDAHYGDTVKIRSSGAVEAAKVGAKAVLIRSVTAESLRTPHTGATHYEEGVPKIPAAAITDADAEFLARMQARGLAVKVELEMGAKTLPDAKSGNAIGEIVGRERPEEIVVIGGHIDSWDVGDGAHDDGAGCLMAMEALTLLQEAGLRPRRTIRAVLFTNEENGLRGAKAYFAAHGQETHVAAIEADIGAGEPQGIGVAGTPEQVAALARYLPLFGEIGLLEINEGWGGADISPLTEAGVLGLSMRPDFSHYFDLHHSAADTVDKVDPEHLERNAAALALMAFILAERE